MEHRKSSMSDKMRHSVENINVFFIGQEKFAIFNENKFLDIFSDLFKCFVRKHTSFDCI
jgi:hypothetical protein